MRTVLYLPCQNTLKEHRINTSVADGFEIMEYLATYIRPGYPIILSICPAGLGKCALPELHDFPEAPVITIRTLEGKIMKYEDHET